MRLQLAPAGLLDESVDGPVTRRPGGKGVDGGDHFVLAHWQVLKNYGNMSSATALFVLKEALADEAHGRFLLAAFGPGFSGYFIVLEL